MGAPATNENEPVLPANDTRSGVSLTTRRPGVRRDRVVEPRGRREVGDADPEVVDDASAAHRAVMDGLGAVAVGIEQERSVVVVAVLRPAPRCPIAGESGRGTGLPEQVDLLTRGSDEAHMQSPGRRILIVRARQREVLPLGERPGPVGLLDPERLEHGVVEALRRGPVAGADGHVVEHGPGTVVTERTGLEIASGTG